MPLSVEHKSELLKLAKDYSIQHHIGFKNFTENVSVPDAIVYEVKTTSELQRIVQRVSALNKTSPSEKIVLRVAAGGRRAGICKNEYSHSYSMTPCTEGNVIVRLVGEEFQHVNLVKDEKQVVRVGAGVQVGELDKLLYQKHNLTLPTSSLIPYVTFVGLMVNAGHGTGRNQPAVTGLVRAIRIMGPDGVIERIDRRHPHFYIIRGSHLGLFGVILDVEIECIPAKKLRCISAARSMNELIEEIESGLFDNHEYVSVMYIPTYQRNEANQRNIMVSMWDPVPTSVNDTNNSPCLSHLEQSVAIGLNNLINVPEILTENNCLIPGYMKHLVARNQVGDASTADVVSIGPWYDIAHYQTAYPWNLDDADYLFRVRGRSVPEIIAALRNVTARLEAYARRGLYPVIHAIYLRFFKGTNGGLSTSSTQYADERICAFDIVSSAHIPGYAAFRAEMDALFFGLLHAKPHWGKTVPLGINYQTLYGEDFTTFKHVLREWHERCGLTLENSPFINHFFNSVLQVSPVPASLYKEEKMKSNSPAASLMRSHIAAKEVVEHIAKIKIQDQHIQELKNDLQRIMETQKASFLQFPKYELKFQYAKAKPVEVKTEVTEIKLNEFNLPYVI